MFVLQLNPMRSNAENVIPVARAEKREDLLALLQREAVPYYKDEEPGGYVWGKSFRKGGPLEWFNDPGPGLEPWIGVPAIVDIGTRDDWAQSAAERYDRTVQGIPAL